MNDSVRTAVTLNVNDLNFFDFYTHMKRKPMTQFTTTRVRRIVYGDINR